MNQDVSFLTLPDRTLAYQQTFSPSGRDSRPGLVFLGGFASDMTGTKASFLADMAVREGWAFLRFDYRGHGQSSGRFEEGCIGDWLDDTIRVVESLTKGPQVFVGSSMGGWLALLLARQCPERFAGFVGLAAAPDFTEDLIVPFLTEGQKEELARDGRTFDIDPPPDHRVPLTRRLLEEGRERLVLRAPIKAAFPIRLIQGQRDREVPWQTALKIAEVAQTDDVQMMLIKDGDHRLSRPQDLALIGRTVQSLMG